MQNMNFYFGVRLPEKLARAVRDYAKRNTLSESAAIRLALLKFFNAEPSTDDATGEAHRAKRQ